ncbi:hypothetical protein BS47DRAFT_1489125 [Hydnum rufescens UP504]|uniref:Uncharacterized protein n=1 Tax=Hydnum rufescens UP504 TaxID=1448309 RepID=A0A9P6AJR9_9AGAM|nr:hypothetical protein BS47DRAFT_1489125 [Hydnum rufescens UP504]
MSVKDIPDIHTPPDSAADDNMPMSRSVYIDVDEPDGFSDVVQSKISSRRSSSRSVADTESPPSAPPAPPALADFRGRVVQFADRVRITSGIRSAHVQRASLANGSTSTPRSTSRSSSISDTASSMSVPLRPPAETTPHAYAHAPSISALSAMMDPEDRNVWLSGLQVPIVRQKRPHPRSRSSDSVTERTPLVMNRRRPSIRHGMIIPPEGPPSQGHDTKSVSDPSGPQVLSSAWWRTKWEQCCSCSLFLDDESGSI